MLIELSAGPVPECCSMPPIEGLERFVRTPRAGDVAGHEPCPICGGAGALFRHRHGLRVAETCRRCGGRGCVEGVVVARLASLDRMVLAAFRAWALDHHLPFGARLLLREEGGAEGDGHGYALVWASPGGGPLTERRGYLSGRCTIGVAVEANGSVSGHVAAHALTDDFEIRIAGLWDFSINASGGVDASWSDRASRGIVRAWSVPFPHRAVAAALERARCPGCRHAVHFATGRDHRRDDRRQTDRAAQPAVVAAN